MDNPEIRQALEKEISKRAKEQSPVRPEEAETIVELIHTGELYQDAVYSLTRIFKLSLNELGNAGTVPEIVADIVKIPAAVVSDIINVFEFIRRLDFAIDEIKDNKSPKNFNILNNTLKTVFQIAIIGEVIETTNDLFAEENESLRIALLIYARLNKINLEEKDIDVVRETILTKDNPQLGALLIDTLNNAPRLIGN